MFEARFTERVLLDWQAAGNLTRVLCAPALWVRAYKMAASNRSQPRYFETSRNILKFDDNAEQQNRVPSPHVAWRGHRDRRQVCPEDKNGCSGALDVSRLRRTVSSLETKPKILNLLADQCLGLCL